MDHVVSLVSLDKLANLDYLDLMDNLEAMADLDLKENLDHREMLVCTNNAFTESQKFLVIFNILNVCNLYALCVRSLNNTNRRLVFFNEKFEEKNADTKFEWNFPIRAYLYLFDIIKFTHTF